MIEEIRKFANGPLLGAMEIMGIEANQLVSEFEALKKRIEELTSQLRSSEDEALLWRKKCADEIQKRLQLCEQLDGYKLHKSWDDCSEQVKFAATSTGNPLPDAKYEIVSQCNCSGREATQEQKQVEWWQNGTKTETVTLDAIEKFTGEKNDRGFYTFKGEYNSPGGRVCVEIPNAIVHIEALSGPLK